MSQDHYPAAGSADDGIRLPAQRDNAPVQPYRVGGRALSLDVQDERRGGDGEIDLLAYWKILVKRKWLVLGVLAAVVAFTLFRTLTATPIYRATAVLQLDKSGTQVVQTGVVQPMDYGWDPDFMQTQIELIKSRSLAERVANELELDQTTMSRLYQPGWLDRMMGALRPKSSASGQKAKAKPDGAINPEQQMRVGAGVVRSGLGVQPVPDSRLVQINYDSPSPEFSARVANAVAEGFIAAGLERRFGATSYAKTYLEDQLALTKAKLEETERKLVEFAQKENLVNTGGQNSQSLAAQNLTQLNAALASAQDQRIRAQARWQQASSGPMPADMIGNSNIRVLQQQKAQLQGTYQQKLQTFKPEWPEMQQMKGQIDEVNRQIAQETSGVRASVKAEYDAAAAQERMLVGQIAALRTEALDVDERSIQYNILKREADTNRQIYDSLLQRYKEVGVAGDVRSNNVSIIDRAEVPRWRFKPSLSTNLMFGLLLGLVLGVLAAFVLEFLDDTLKTSDDVEQKLKLPVLGVIPKLGAKESVAAMSKNAQSAFSEAYRSVRTALHFSTDQGVPKTLLVTSTEAGEGKSTTSLALARNFIQLGKRVLLIEADLRNPSLHRELGLRGMETGLSNVLTGGGTLADAILKTDDNQLDVILAGPLPPNPAELLAGSKLVSLLTVVSERYDQIIVDSPPVLGLADTPILANAVDGTLLVVYSGKTKAAAAQATLKRLLHARARIVGALLTKYDMRSGGYGYGYNYRYQAYSAHDRRLRFSKR